MPAGIVRECLPHGFKLYKQGGTQFFPVCTTQEQLTVNIFSHKEYTYEKFFLGVLGYGPDPSL
jgi:hypothetical protein